MDKYEHSNHERKNNFTFMPNKQYKTTDTSPELRKARCDIARALGLLKTEINTPFPNCIIMTSLKILELFLRHSKNIIEFSKNKSLKTQILRKKSCFDQIL